MSCAVDFEISVVNYSRLHGLSIDHQAETLPQTHIKTLQQKLPAPLTDTNLQCIEFPIYVNNTEHLIVDKGAAILLQNANNGLTSPKEIESFMLPLLDIRYTKKLRVEVALLRTDHGSDVRAFAGWEDSHIKDGCLPVEPLDNEMDVGLEFPPKLRSLPAELMTELNDEKFGVTKDTMAYLQAKIKEIWTTEDEESLWDRITSYKKDALLYPLTPPLLPMSPPTTPYIPSSPACHLPILSDPASLISQDLQNAERTVFEDDVLISPKKGHDSSTASSATISRHSDLKLSDIYLPPNYMESSGPSLAEKFIKLDDRKVEVPLLPTKPTSLSKTVSFNETAGEMLLDPIFRPGAGNSSVAGSEEETDKFFEEAFRTVADEAVRRIEQEQLQEADTKSRVEIPIMDFTLPDSLWIRATRIGGSTEMAITRKAELIDILGECGHLQIWPGVKKLEPKLRWIVFQRELANVALNESFVDEEVLHNFIGHSKDSLVMDSGGLTWKPLGLRILKEDEDDDEDELPNGQFEGKQRQDIVSLVKKRKMLFNEEGLADARVTGSNIAFSKAILLDPDTFESRNHSDGLQRKTVRCKATANKGRDFVLDDQEEKYNQKGQSTLFDGGIFSAADALDSYLEIRAAKKQKLVESVYFTDQVAVNNSLIPDHQVPAQESAPVSQSQIIHQLLPVPSISIPTSPTPYIICSAILKHRILIRTLSGLFPTAVPIERDFAAHNTTSWLPNSITRSPVPSVLATEADLIISPSTGVILTTLQKIKQKPLPGQKAKSAFKDRIEQVSTRYERLIVLINEGCNDESTNGLTELDAVALTEVIGYCSSLETAVIVQFIAGGEKTLAKWLVGAMGQFGIQGTAIVPLLEDETLWELFLRRSGLNAYAAQVVIATLKAPEGVNELGASKAGIFGITAFVEMGQEERRRRFRTLLGGVRVLDRVGRVLDAEWA